MNTLWIIFPVLNIGLTLRILKSQNQTSINFEVHYSKQNYIQIFKLPHNKRLPKMFNIIFLGNPLPFDAPITLDAAVYGLEQIGVGVIRVDDLLGEFETLGQVFKLMILAVVLELVVFGYTTTDHQHHQITKNHPAIHFLLIFFIYFITISSKKLILAKYNSQIAHIFSSPALLCGLFSEIGMRYSEKNSRTRKKDRPKRFPKLTMLFYTKYQIRIYRRSQLLWQWVVHV